MKLEGFLAVEGDVLIIGDLNRSRSDALLAIVAGENIFVEEIERPLLGGGELLLFAGEALVLDWRGTEPLELRGGRYRPPALAEQLPHCLQLCSRPAL